MNFKLYKALKNTVILLILCLCSQFIKGQSKNKPIKDIEVLETKSDTCVVFFYKAREDYFNGDFGKIHKKLVNCIQEFEDENKMKSHYENPKLIFQVYKLITTAYYETNEDYRAEEMEKRLVNYFALLPEKYKMSTKEVIDNLENTNF